MSRIGLVARAQGHLADIELPQLSTQVDKEGDRYAVRDTETAEGVDAVAKTAGLHEYRRVATGGVRSHGDAYALLFSGARDHVEKRIVLH